MTHIIECPHCHLLVSIIEINCKIFRHGIYKNNGLQMNPHASKEECDKLISQDLIYGCGKPFYYDGNEVKKCDYI